MIGKEFDIYSKLLYPLKYILILNIFKIKRFAKFR